MTLTTTNLFSLRFLSAAGPEQVGHMGDGPRLVRFLQKAWGGVGTLRAQGGVTFFTKAVASLNSAD